VSKPNNPLSVWPTGAASPGDGLIHSEDWRATLEVDPETNELFVLVRGTLIFATPGFSARLLTHRPQGLDPRTLLLDLDISRPRGPQTPAVTRQRVHFVADRADLTDVMILTTGIDIPVGAVA
jgi:hypothetical protein